MTKKTKRKEHNIDDDPMFDISESAMSNALDRRLIQFFERIERLEEEKKGMADDIRDVYSEAKSTGYDPKTMKPTSAPLVSTDRNPKIEKKEYRNG
jgi:uncharacterized protein (UPF0335 family)